ncbi:hypothetical protein ARMGADRAFT_1063488 [Armillaria gallica]|uniref:Uncharacterized protein n=1 Tax=Armillaria gallica TaxID=47427 RepID=A0A2H3DFG5_ARMGA|nr:hypothetical protein ARMGADRAFT_1063488 [Armillaria gallica]
MVLQTRKGANNTAYSQFCFYLQEIVTSRVDIAFVLGEACHVQNPHTGAIHFPAWLADFPRDARAPVRPTYSTPYYDFCSRPRINRRRARLEREATRQLVKREYTQGYVDI